MHFQDWEIWLIHSLQNTGEWIKPVMEFFTALGYPQAYMIIVAIIYWSLDRKLGLRLAIFLPLVSMVNSLLKFALHAPRPYWISSDIKAIHASGGFGMPSGHAQASTVWLLAGSYLRKKWFWIIAILTSFLVGLSRPYLGVHFPTQVVTGWALGLALMLCFLRFEAAVADWFQKRNLSRQLLIISGMAVLILISGAIIQALTREWSMPMDWIHNASPNLSLDDAMIRSYSMAAIAGNTGSFMGVAMGAILMGRAKSFQVKDVWWKRVLRVLLGLACIALLYYGVKKIEPDNKNLLVYSSWRFLGFYLISFLAVYLLPRLFISLKLLSVKNSA